MTVKRMFALLAVLVVLCLTIGMMPDEVYAQNNAGPADSLERDLVTKQSVRDTMAGVKKKEEDAGLGPSKAQMALGVGSFIVMIIVVKWL